MAIPGQVNMNNSLYTSKSASYFSTVRMDVISVLPHNPDQKIMEVGAGGCDTLLFIRENGLTAEVMGVELMALPGTNQQHPAIDKLQLIDIEKENIDAPFNYFDVIICADVLEHLADPWLALEKIVRHLKPGGIVVASIPNIREIKTILQILVRGDFKYDVSGGVLDKTHLRFFCKKNMKQLLAGSNLQAEFCKPNYLLRVVKSGRKRRIINLLTLGLFTDLLTVQYILKARKKA